mmetsp:Transcript_25203/g.78508  ORF Transcript_25203/g.78508 Transcript_25203/m.78508 type:complete len:268 (+) Transcript_25203:126-929(+)
MRSRQPGRTSRKSGGDRAAAPARVSHDRAAPAQHVVLTEVARRTLALHHLKEWFGLVVDVDVDELKLIVDRGEAEAVQLEEFAAAPVALVLARKCAPMAPREADGRRAREHLEQLPGERSEGRLPPAVRVLPRRVGPVPQLRVDPRHEHVVVPDLERLHVAVLLPPVRAEPEPLGVDRPVLARFQLVAALHLPRLDEVLDDLLERALGVHLRALLQVEVVGEAVVRRAAEAPLGVRIVHEAARGLLHAVLRLEICKVGSHLVHLLRR